MNNTTGCSVCWRDKGYEQHDWLFCMLENFGGNVGLHGRLDQLLNNFYLTKNNPLAEHLKGIGLTMEGSENNPMMFELMCELPWRPEKITKEAWLKEYLAARYGVKDEKIEQAWEIDRTSMGNPCQRHLQLPLWKQPARTSRIHFLRTSQHEQFPSIKLVEDGKLLRPYFYRRRRTPDVGSGG